MKIKELLNLTKELKKIGVIGWSNAGKGEVIDQKKFNELKKEIEKEHSDIKIMKGVDGLNQMSNPNLDSLEDVYIGNSFYLYKVI